MAEQVTRKFQDGPLHKRTTKRNDPWLTGRGNPLIGHDLLKFQRTYTFSQHEGAYKLVKLPNTGTELYQWVLKPA